MPSFTCSMEATVRADRVDDLEALIRKMFSRRHHNRVSAGPSGQMWLTVELVQSLRRASQVYREFSTKTTGPLPFELGFLRIRNGHLESISDPLRIEHPELFVRMISEFVEPGARIRLTKRSDSVPGVKRALADTETVEETDAEETDAEETNTEETDTVEAVGPSGGMWTIDDVGEVTKEADGGEADAPKTA